MRDRAALRRSEPAAWLALTVYDRVRAKLEREPVEDFRIDFEDGFGARPDAEEDATAVAAGREVARAMAQRWLPPFIGIRIKSFGEEWKRRGARTLELFLDTLLAQTQGRRRGCPTTSWSRCPRSRCPSRRARWCACSSCSSNATSWRRAPCAWRS